MIATYKHSIKLLALCSVANRLTIKLDSDETTSLDLHDEKKKMHLIKNYYFIFFWF